MKVFSFTSAATAIAVASVATGRTLQLAEAFSGQKQPRNYGYLTTFSSSFAPSAYPRGSSNRRRRSGGYGEQPGGGRSVVDDAFRDLREEIRNQEPGRRGDGCSPRSSPFGAVGGRPFVFSFDQRDPEAIRKQKEWANRAFDFVSGLNRDFSSSTDEAERTEDEIRQVRGYVNRLYDSFVAPASTSDVVADEEVDTSGRKKHYSPRFEVRDTEEAYEYLLEVPGVIRSDINITLLEEKVGPEPVVYLVIEGERRRGKPRPRNQKEEEEAVAAVETFSKRFMLNDDADTDKISASLENGVLTVSVIKVKNDEVEDEEATARSIPIM